MTDSDVSSGAHHATLICWSCGVRRPVLMTRAPEFGFELLKAATDVGMVGYFDNYRGRALIFCTNECAQSQKTKGGNFRLHPRMRTRPNVDAAVPGRSPSTPAGSTQNPLGGGEE